MKVLQKKELLTLDREFFSTFVEIPPSQQLINLANGERIDGFDFNVTAKEEPKKGIGSREHFGNVIREVIHLNAVQRYHDCDGRNRTSIGTHKPNYLERAEDFAGEQGIVCVGEIKGIQVANQEFPDEDVGQILDFIQELLQHQGWRKWAFGFLTDGIRFEFFRGMRRGDVAGGDGTISFTKSGLRSKGEGWRRLSQLLQQSNQHLGFTIITVPGWKLDTWLGSGASTSVFKATSSDGDTAVCKIFIGKDALAYRQNEFRALQLMSTDPNTPKLRDVAVQETGGEQSLPVLLVTPVGEPLGFHGVRLPIHAYAVLVDTLRRSHELGLCHFDVCGDNMFAVRSNPFVEGIVEYKLILNDWASSMLTIDVNQAKSFSTHRLFYDINRMGPTEDLVALVRAVFVLTQQCTFLPVETAQELDEKMRQQWSWSNALDCARDGGYTAIGQFFRTGTFDNSTVEVASKRKF